MKKWLATCAAVGILLVGKDVVQAQSFTDVPATHTYYTEIEEMKELGVINGYENQQFRPGNDILRKHVAALIAKSVDLPVKRPATTFADVSPASSYYETIQQLYQAGVIDGDVRNGQRYYHPDASLTRAHLAKILSLAYELEAKGSATFLDVDPNHWSADYIDRLYTNHITTGNNGRFLPNHAVTRQHFATFMYRALGEKQLLSLDGQANYTLQQWVKEGAAFAPGYYEGRMIKPGEYVFASQEEGLHYFGEQLVTGESFASEIFNTFGYVNIQGLGNVETGGYLINTAAFNETKWQGARDFYAALTNRTGYSGSGMYKVGVDIAPGNHVLLSTKEGAYVEVRTGPIGNGHIEQAGFFTGSFPLKLENGKYILFTDAQL